jgi:CheY-like chemotaxis protein
VNRIYVVDDEPDMVELLATVLKGEGYDVETYTDGRAALARVLEEPPDLLLLDLMMPDLDGFELLKLLRLDSRGKPRRGARRVGPDRAPSSARDAPARGQRLYLQTVLSSRARGPGSPASRSTGGFSG